VCASTPRRPAFAAVYALRPKAVTPIVFSRASRSVPRTVSPRERRGRRASWVVASASSTTGVVSVSPSTRSLSRSATPPTSSTSLAELREPSLNSSTQRSFERAAILARRHAEELIVELYSRRELVDMAPRCFYAESTATSRELA